MDSQGLDKPNDMEKKQTTAKAKPMAESSQAKPDTTDDLVDRLPEFFTISIIAKRNSGKTYLMTDIIRVLKKKKRVDRFVVLTGSAGLNEDYKDVIDEKLILPFKEETLENIWKLQMVKPREQREHILIVLDDCLANPAALRSEMVNRLYTQSRHLQISLAVLSQYGAHLLTPLRKANSDAILWYKLNLKGLENLWLSTSKIPKDKFIQISEKFAGHNYQYLVLDNYIQSANPSDQLTFIKAK
jgi:hypothetical protein